MRDATLSSVVEGQRVVAALRSGVAHARRLLRAHGPAHGDLDARLDAIARHLDDAQHYGTHYPPLAAELATLRHEVGLLRAAAGASAPTP